MRHTVVDEIVAVTDEPVLGVHVGQIGLRIDPARVVADLGQRGAQQPSGVALAARAAFGAQPADPKGLLAAGVLLHQPQCADHLAVRRFQPEMPGFGEQVAPVQLRVRASLFDDENLHPQFEQLVKGSRVKVFGPDTTQRFCHEASSCSTLVPHDHTSS